MVALTTAVPAGAVDSGLTADFNGDGYADLASGVPGEGVDAQCDAGAVEVVYGSRLGLSMDGVQVWTQSSPGIADAPEPGDRFGAVVASGDFDADGFSDLAIGVPGEDVGRAPNAGAVHVLYGSRRGLVATGSAFFAQNLAGTDTPERGDRFGSALAVGRLDSGGYDDLAIGVPREGVGRDAEAGAVDVLYGSRTGLTSTFAQHWTSGYPGVPDTPETGDHFGAAVAAGDFDGDGLDDLSIGVPYEDLGTIVDAGAVIVLRSASWGVSGWLSQEWSQDSPRVPDPAESGDHFGATLAAARFGGDGRADLAIGVPGEDLAVADAGAVEILEGSATGLDTIWTHFFSQDTPGIADRANAGDHFGGVLAIASLAHDARPDLVVGVPDENLGAARGAGVVHILPSDGDAPSAMGSLIIRESAPLLSSPETGDRFGAGVAAGDFDGNGYDDLVVGAPGETVRGRSGAGMALVVWGTWWTLGDGGGSTYDQSLAGVPSSPWYDEHFAAAVAA